MALIQFEIPEEVVKFIKAEFNIEPTTYLQSQVVDPIIEKYKAKLKEERHAEVEAEVEGTAAAVKTAMKIKIGVEKLETKKK